MQNYYLVQIEKDAKGRSVAALKSTVKEGLTDAYAGECKMKDE